ncbi:MAG: rhodanese-like domain-containing protein [Bacteroidetes bacterium]|nr:rhodanese-like domain-containing protein [Bacteroidota bacterium]
MGLFGIIGFGKKKKRITGLLDKKALIIDVRTTPEYHTGHIRESINIPLHTLDVRIKKIRKKNIPVCTCSRSGHRGGIAAKSLRHKGIDEVNGGSWKSLNKIVMTHKMSRDLIDEKKF